MKRATPFIGALVLTTTVIAAAMAGDYRKILPQQFVGEWCVVGSDDKAETYSLGRCNNPDSDGNIAMRPDGFTAWETRCKIVWALQDKPDGYMVRFSCSGEGKNWTQYYRMSIQLHMSELDSRTQPKR